MQSQAEGGEVRLGSQKDQPRHIKVCGKHNQGDSWERWAKWTPCREVFKCEEDLVTWPLPTPQLSLVPSPLAYFTANHSKAFPIADPCLAILGMLPLCHPPEPLLVIPSPRKLS